MKVYKIIAKHSLCFDSEAWVNPNQDERRITAAEMKYIRTTDDYSFLNYQRSETVVKEVTTRPVEYVALTTKGLQERKHKLESGTTAEKYVIKINNSN